MAVRTLRTARAAPARTQPRPHCIGCENGRVTHVLAVARVYSALFAVIVLALLLQPGPFFGPQQEWYERLALPVAGLAMLLIGWAWLLRIRRGVERP